ncbi:dienelactone hydrolase family protein [Gemmatimonas sp.]|uniref:dienelactone hydrolase family protein n=1 Tax=Gemmatimonas sp. TaxID=1962908 RepID=UPI003982E5B6
MIATTHVTRLAAGAALLLAVTAAAGAQSTKAAQPDYAAAMHREHLNETPTASAGAHIAPRVEVVGRTVTYATINGKAIKGFLAKPAVGAKTGKAIIMVHEWWGLNDGIQAMAKRYAGEGYTVLAVDLFGSVATTPDAAMKLYQAGMADIAGGEKNLGAAISYLKKAGAKSIGSVGYCYGGHWSLRTGLVGGSKLDAVVMYYGAPITDPAQLARLKAPVLGLFGGKDTGIPLDSVRAMEAAITKLGGSVTINVYANANHAFANPTGQAYDRTAAEDAFAKTVSFFKANLK